MEQNNPGYRVELVKKTSPNTPKSIFVLDDILLHLTAVKSRLKSRYKVYTAQSADIFMYNAKIVKPDLILLDINMPGKDGFKVLDMLKEDNDLMDTPVVFLSSNKDRNSLEKAIKHGAADYVFKPFTNEKIIERIEYHLDPNKNMQDSPIILAIDDCSTVLQTVFNMLQKSYFVYTLTNPEQLNDVLKEVIPDLILLDYNMPSMNGFELIPIIREVKEHRETPIIMLTSESSPEYITSAIRLGACDYIRKPADEKILLKKIESYLKSFLIRRLIRKQWSSKVKRNTLT